MVMCCTDILVLWDGWTMQFLKLGGSLITDKHRPYTPLPERLAALAEVIAAFRRERPDEALLLGHGSGSFGHWEAQQRGWDDHVADATGWVDFAHVGHAARRLNQLVMEALLAAGVPAVAFPPSAAAWASEGRVQRWLWEPLRAALKANLVPVVYGDVVFDAARGGVIASTEAIFAFLAPHLHPRRILIAGVEPGVWADYPACTRIVPEITPHNFAAVLPALQGSAAADVTGGMAAKVQAMLDLASQWPGTEVLIFDGRAPETVAAALRGASPGTRVWAP